VIHGLNVLHPATEWPPFPVKHVRLWDNFVHWGAVHVAPYTFDFTRLDALVNTARSQGATNLCYVMSHTPTWLSTTPDGTSHAPWLNAGGNYPPYDLAHWDEYVRTVMERYRGRIQSYQVWNEPQNKWFWYPRQMASVAEMTRRAYRIGRDVDPALRIVSAPLMPQVTNGSGDRLLSALRGKGWPVDVWSAHIYTRPGDGRAAWRRLAEAWRRTLASNNAPKRARWVTETNVNFGGGALPDDLVPLWMDAVDGICTDEGIFKAYWYTYGRHSDTALLGIPFTADSRGTMELQRLTGG
jgi:hypothetical protein